jgi:hypothetical protein
MLDDEDDNEDLVSRLPIADREKKAIRWVLFFFLIGIAAMLMRNAGWL